MTDPRHLARVIAMQTLFVYFNREKINIDESMSHAVSLLNNIKIDQVLSKTLVNWVIKNQKKIEKIVLDKLNDKNLLKIDMLTMSILYIGVYELYFDKTKLAEAIIVNEAVELCKEYWKEKSSWLVNAVLSTK